jgi:hypothetical protein
MGPHLSTPTATLGADFAPGDHVLWFVPREHAWEQPEVLPARVIRVSTLAVYVKAEKPDGSRVYYHACRRALALVCHAAS